MIDKRIARELIGANSDVNKLSQRVVDYVDNIAIVSNRAFRQILDAMTKQAYKEAGIETLAEKVLNEDTKAAVKNMKPGEKYTLFFMNDFGFPCSQKIRFHSYDIDKYAQYHTSIVIAFKCKGGRSIQSKRIYGRNKIYVFKGWVDVKDDMFVTMISSKYVNIKKTRRSFDEQYITDGLNSVDQKPIVLIA